MLWGTGLAIGMGMVLTFAVSCVLLIPGPRFLGAVLLAYIACKLIQEQADQAGDASQAPTSTGTAPAAPPITMFWLLVRLSQSV